MRGVGDARDVGNDVEIEQTPDRFHLRINGVEIHDVIEYTLAAPRPGEGERELTLRVYVRNLNKIHQPCRRPPAGFFCTREAGHDGPCPTWPMIGGSPKRPLSCWIIQRYMEGIGDALYLKADGIWTFDPEQAERGYCEGVAWDKARRLGRRLRAEVVGYQPKGF